MLIDVSAKSYRQYFPTAPHPYISAPFIEMVKGKAERVVHLIEDREKNSMGLVAAIKNQELLSPFSSPFGGFHFRHDNICTSEIDSFLAQLISFSEAQNLTNIKIYIPPDIYHHSFNAKMTNAFLRSGFSMDIPDITHWVDLQAFSGSFSCRNSRANYHRSLQYNLSFHSVTEEAEKEAAYEVIYHNRKRLGYPVYMTFNDFLMTGELWPIDYFQVLNQMGNIVAAAIFYRGHSRIIQGIYWGDSEEGRTLRAMDFCSYNLWNFYKKLGFDFIDLGLSSACGIPNNGLIRFKENHDCTSALRLCFSLLVSNCIHE